MIKQRPEYAMQRRMLAPEMPAVSDDEVEEKFELEGRAILERMAASNTDYDDDYLLLYSMAGCFERGDELRLRVLRVLLEELDLYRTNGPNKADSTRRAKISDLVLECSRWLG